MTDQNRNLLLRVVTALLLLPLVIWLIMLGGWPFSMLIAVAAGLCAVEINQMAAKASLTGAALPTPPAGVDTSTNARSSRLGAGALASVLATFLIPLLDRQRLQGILTLQLVLVALVLIAFIDALFFELDVKRAPTRVAVAVMAPLYAGLTLASLSRLRTLSGGAFWIVLTLVVTWFNDTGGYFAGRALGKHKLYPRISPSKTWEGAVGGALASTLGAVAMKFLFLGNLPLWGAVLIGLGASLFGPLGDLSESMLKRAFGAKDSGKMLPGHGGLLDRLDALLFVAPFVLFCARHIASASTVAR